MRYKEGDEIFNKWLMLNDNYGRIPKYRIGRGLNTNEDYINLDTFGVLKKDSDVLDILEDPLYTAGLSIGDEVTLNKSYTSFKSGQIIIIKDFLDEQKTKIITDGVTPGGWIDSKYLFKKIDYTGLRLKTFLECCIEFGTSWTSTNSLLSYKVYDHLGKGFDKLPIKNNETSFFMGSAVIPGFHVTREPLTEKVYDLRLKSEEEWVKSKGSYSPSAFIEIAQSYKGLWGKSFKNWNLRPSEKKLDIVGLVKVINSNGYIRTTKESVIDHHMIEVVEIK